MPNPIVITIIRKPNGEIQPQEDSQTVGIRTKASINTRVEFRPGGGATSVAVFFDGESPFGDSAQDHQNVRSGTIRKNFNVNEAARNVYAYNCELTINGQTVRWPPLDTQGVTGGEIEIIPAQ